MTLVTASSAASRVVSGGPAMPATGAATTTPSLAIPNSLEGILAFATLAGRDASQHNALSRAGANEAEQKSTLHEVQQAERQAAEARENAANKSGLLKAVGIIATVASIAGASAATICTGGAALPALALTGALLSASSPAIGAVSHELGASDGTRSGLELGFAFGGAALSIGAGFGATTTCAAAKTLESGARIVEAGAHITKAGLTIAQAHNEADATNASADALRGHKSIERIGQDNAAIADELRALTASVQRALKTIRAVANDLDTTKARTIDGLRG